MTTVVKSWSVDLDCPAAGEDGALAPPAGPERGEAAP